jgi:hypothetical protein
MMPASTSILMTAAIAMVGATAVTSSASAITAEVAKKCRELAVKAHPPAVAGSRAGSGQAEREFFRACVAQGGNMKDPPPKEEQKK